MRWQTRRAVGALALALSLLACGDDEPSGAAGDGEGTLELTAAIPFPSGVVFYPLYVAQERGYFEEEGLSVTTEPVDGSGQVLQLLLAGQAQIGLPSPGPFMQSVHEGSDLVSVYTLFQSNVFALVTPEDSAIESLADLAGTTVGVGTIEGGETAFVKALLSQEAGLDEGDYELLAVGDGGTASVGLERGDVAAYAASFPDVAIMRLQGLDLRDLISPEFQSFFDSLVVVERSFLDDNTEAVEGIGRALARATVWGQENPEGVMEITEEFFPEEADDAEFTLALLEETQGLFALPEEADGQWGYAVPVAVERYMAFLLDQGELDAPIDTDVFVNDLVDAYNDFDEGSL
ncbi:MAG: ABC transporter substrate-binding protein [Acidimicrobiales bacterium]